jgi:preprotein translocase subunit YajC
VRYLPSISPEIDQFIQGSWPLILMAVVFYFILWRPQKKEQKKRSEYLSSLKKGDKIVTIGGLYGVIIRLNDKTATIQIADKVEVEIARTAVSNQQPPRGNSTPAE